MGVKHPCAVCKKAVGVKHKAICCDLCYNWVHMKCNKINKQTYEILKNDEAHWFCIKCIENEFPFSKLNDSEMKKTLINNNSQAGPEPNENNTFKTYFDEFDISANNCEYYEPREINNIKYNENKNKSYMHLNIASLPYHYDELNSFLANCKINFDAIAISESKLQKSQPPKTNIALPGYRIEHTPTESSKGGALIYINNNLKYKLRNDLKIYKKNELESIFIEIINEKTKNDIIGCIYRHPSMPTYEFNDCYLRQLINKLSHENKNTILMGDFNINLLNYDIDNDVSEFFDTLCSNSLLPTITLPTRITPKSRTLIDNIISNDIIHDYTAGNITTTFSDHLAQFLIIKTHKPKIPKTNIFERNFKKFDEKNFLLDLLGVNWEDHIQTKNNNPDFAMQQFLKIINSILDRYAPVTKRSKKTTKLKEKPWITNGILTSIKIKNKMYKKYCKTKDKEKQIKIFNYYKTYHNLINKLIKQSKIEHYQEYFKEHKYNLIKTWKGIKELINIKTKSQNQLNSLQINNELTTDSNIISNSANTFFTTIASKLEAKLIPEQSKSYLDYLPPQNEKSFFIHPTTPKEVENLISNLKNNKSTGPNSIPTKILKLTKKIISEPLCNIINISFNTGVFPESMKSAKVIPIFKKGDETQITNYRPISVLSNISKIFEKLMHTRLYNFLDNSGTFYENQYGFRNKHSTNHALIQITEEIREAIDNNKFACGVFIDLQKAFDTVNHNILLGKLQQYGIRGTTLKWFQTYLQNRTQFVIVNGTQSDKLILTHGVPQGSVLGPLLFLIYINDLHRAILFSKTIHFADDTNLLKIDNSLKKINKHINYDLKQLCTWLRCNKISLNASKTEIIIFKSKQKNFTKHLNFRISGQQIQTKTMIKYLGLIIDENLLWETHLNTLKLKLARANGMLAKIRHYVPFHILKNIYYSIFNCHILYGCQIWGQKENTLKTINKLQKKSLRILHFKNYTDKITSSFAEDKILPLSKLVSYNNCLFVYEQLKGITPISFNSYFTTVENVHNHQTRGAGLKQLKMPQVNTETYGIYSIKYQSALAWNNITGKLNKPLTNENINKIKNLIKTVYLSL